MAKRLCLTTMCGLTPSSTLLTSSPRLCVSGRAYISSYTAAPIPSPIDAGKVAEQPQINNQTSCLARLPTSHILRSMFLSFFFTTPLLFKPGLAVFQGIARSTSPLLNPDRNPFLRCMIRPLVYDQFCAGRNAIEIGNCSTRIKDLGFSGVVLCYSKEVQVDNSGKSYGYEGTGSDVGSEIAQWRAGTLETLEMTKAGDWIGIKMTGAGPIVTQALMDNEEMPQQFLDALDAICQRAAEKNTRVWIDAEQQACMGGIDAVTYRIMRKFNCGERAVVYNTIQGYLKKARSKVQTQLQTAAKEGWRSGIKLVRGAYIGNDDRTLIHDTKTDTDESYNSIVGDLLRGTTFEVFQQHPDLEHDLILAGHNSHTIRTAFQLGTELAAEGKLKVMPDFAQLQGMADDIGCELLQSGEQAAKDSRIAARPTFVPEVFKCLTWGSIQECMQYLTRRLIENRGAADRMKEGIIEMRKELGRRLFFRNHS